MAKPPSIWTASTLRLAMSTQGCGSVDHDTWIVPASPGVVRRADAGTSVRHFTQEGVNVFDQFKYELRRFSVSKIPTSESVFEMHFRQRIPEGWSQVATDILHKNISVKQVFRKPMAAWVVSVPSSRWLTVWPIAGSSGRTLQLLL